MTALRQYLLPKQQVFLILQLARREVHARYRQSWLGLLWVVLTPILMLGVYTLVFRHVMQVRWHGAIENDVSFALRIYAGLAVFNFFADCVNRAPGLILEQPQLVKKVVFPLEILPWVNALSALVGLGVAGVLLLIMTHWGTQGLSPTALLLPLVWLPLIPLVLGMGWLLSGIGTYVRDVSQLLGMAVSALMFLSPIFFPIEALPEAWKNWMLLNPLAWVMTSTRMVLLSQNIPDLTQWALVMGGCSGFAALGAMFFHRVRSGFADVV